MKKKKKKPDIPPPRQGLSRLCWPGTDGFYGLVHAAAAAAKADASEFCKKESLLIRYCHPIWQKQLTEEEILSLFGNDE